MSDTISLTELEQAIATLEVALSFAEKSRGNDEQYKIARDACIQRFEYCIELSWKTAMKKLGSSTKFPKPAVREMARADLIASAEQWLAFVEARNDTSHSYDENVAKRVFAEILNFSTQVRDLLQRLKNLP